MKRMILVFALLMSSSRVAAQPEATPILPPEPPWSGASTKLAVPADHPWATPFEVAGHESTPRYAETVEWIERLVASAPELELTSIGRSAEGRDIWMVIASREGASTSQTLAANGRPTLLAHSGIHSGEIDGKDAGMMLLRDLTVGGSLSELLDSVNLLFIPILGVDGHERFSRFSRINQRGPVEMGWRTNARNLNLNRDFTKLESEELQALVAMINRWRPDLYLDLHVTDGEDYQYDITYGFNGRHAWSPNVATWLADVFEPAADADLEAMGHVPGPLTFGVNGRDMRGGKVDWTASPRFSNGWGDARHLPTILVENHSLKSYPRRVFGTRVLLESALRILAEHAAGLRAARRADEETRSGNVVLGWTASTETPPTMMFRGIRSERFLSSITGEPEVRWTGEPVTEEIPVIAMTKPTATVRRPAWYYLPSAWGNIAAKLELQGIEVEQLTEPLTVDVEQLRLPDAALDAANTPFEGRTRYRPGEPVVERGEITLPRGSYRISTSQPLGTLTVLMLEPESPDSLFQWGYFASILQRTEYVEAYVMEPMARAMLDADPDLRREFEQALVSDPELAGSRRARLQWFYEKTPFFDQRHRLYPVSRSID